MCVASLLRYCSHYAVQSPYVGHDTKQSDKLFLTKEALVLLQVRRGLFCNSCLLDCHLGAAAAVAAINKCWTVTLLLCPVMFGPDMFSILTSGGKLPALRASEFTASQPTVAQIFQSGRLCNTLKLNSITLCILRPRLINNSLCQKI